MIIFIYGQDSFRSRQKLNELKGRFIHEVDEGGHSVAVIKGEKAELSAISNALSAGSLFSKKKLVIIENIFSNRGEIIFKELRDMFLAKEKTRAGLEPDPQENIVIFYDENSGEKMGKNVFWQFLLKQKFVQNFSLLSATALSTWIKKRADELGAQLSGPQCQKISAMYGGSLWQTDSELKKIINYKRGQSTSLLEGGRVTLTEADLIMLSRGKIDENIFALTDAIGSKNKKLALALLENELSAGVAEAYLMTMIIRQFRILLQLRQALDAGLSQQNMSVSLKLHPFVVKKNLREAGGYTLDFLRNIFNKLVDLDNDLKTGRAEFRLALSLLIAKL